MPTAIRINEVSKQVVVSEKAARDVWVPRSFNSPHGRTTRTRTSPTCSPPTAEGCVRTNLFDTRRQGHQKQPLNASATRVNNQRLRTRGFRRF